MPVSEPERYEKWEEYLENCKKFCCEYMLITDKYDVDETVFE